MTHPSLVSPPVKLSYGQFWPEPQSGGLPGQGGLGEGRPGLVHLTGRVAAIGYMYENEGTIRV